MTGEAELVMRQRATQLTVDKFMGSELSWEQGKTCIHMMHAHLLHMGHAKPPAMPCVRSPAAAKRALKKRGCDSVEELLDTILVRLPAPAFARLGDIATAEGEHGLAAILINTGRNTWLGWHEDAERAVMVAVSGDELTGAWCGQGA